MPALAASFCFLKTQTLDFVASVICYLRLTLVVQMIITINLIELLCMSLPFHMLSEKLHTYVFGQEGKLWYYNSSWLEMSS